MNTIKVFALYIGAIISPILVTSCSSLVSKGIKVMESAPVIEDEKRLGEDAVEAALTSGPTYYPCVKRKGIRLWCTEY